MMAAGLFHIPLVKGQTTCPEVDITGPNYVYNLNCDYTLSNTNGLMVTVTLTTNSGIITTNGNSTNTYTALSLTGFHVLWNPQGTNGLNYVTITVTVSDGTCTGTSTLNVFPHCFWYFVYEHLYDEHIYSDKTYGVDPNLNPPGSYQLSGTMHIISGDVTFDNAHFYMSPEAKILIYPGASLTITNGSTIQHVDECAYMWKGIYLLDPTATLTINGGSIIKDALSAVVSKNNAAFFISDSYFQNNYIGISVSDFLPGIPGINYNCTVSNTTFECLNSNSLLQYPPYQNNPVFCGIKVDNVLGIVLGQQGVIPPYHNYFYNMLYGIYSRNSILASYFNNFKDIKPFGESSQSAAISAHYTLNQSPQPDFQPRLIVDDQNQIGNYFETCSTGIDNYNQPAKIRKAVFLDCGTSIKCKNTVSTTEILENDIVSLSNPPLNGFGIYVFSGFTNPDGIELNIDGNEIVRIDNPIYVNSQMGTLKKHPNITNNIIEWDNANISLPQTGINIQNCDYANIFGNSIEQKNHLVTSNDIDLIRGIRIAQSLNANIESNELIRMGSGIFTNGSLINTQFRCNNLEYCYHGFYFSDYTALSDQGQFINDPYLIPNNQFIGSSSYPYPERISQKSVTPPSIIGAPIKWSYDDSDPSIYGPFKLDWNLNLVSPNHSCHSYIIGLPLNDFKIPCENPIINKFYNEINDTLIRENQYGKIIREQNGYITLIDQYKWYEKKYLYQSVLNDSNLVSLGGTDDIRYQEVYDSLKISSTGNVEKLNSYMVNYQYSLAENQNNELSGNEGWLANIKATTQIYLNTWAAGIQRLSGSDSITLWPIALMTPYEGGPGVYTARFMLDIDPENFNVPYRIETDKNPLVHNFEMFPNPASGMVTIRLNSFTESNAKVDFYGITGNLIYSIPFKTNNTETNISLTNITPGVYFCRINIPGFQTRVQKLVVIK